MYGTHSSLNFYTKNQLLLDIFFHYIDWAIDIYFVRLSSTKKEYKLFASVYFWKFIVHQHIFDISFFLQNDGSRPLFNFLNLRFSDSSIFVIPLKRFLYKEFQQA